MNSEFEAAKKYFLSGLNYLNASKNELAELDFRRSLELCPKRPSTLTNLQIALIRLGKFEDALEVSELLIDLEPTSPEAHLNLGNAQKEIGLRERAEYSYQKALAIKPDYEIALNNLGVLYLESGRILEAKVKFFAALESNPWSGLTLSNLGALQIQTGEFDKALVSLTNSLAVNPNAHDAWNNLGNLHFALKNYPAALEAYSKALNLNPETNWLYAMLLHVRLRMCDWKEYDDSISHLLKLINKNQKAGPPFTLLGLPVNAIEQKFVASEFVQHNFAARSLASTRANEKADKRIRVAYISSDYFDHATSYLLAELIELHDRSHFEIVGICYGRPSVNEMRERLTRSFDIFVNVFEKSDYEIAELIRTLGVDIAVDLKGHTQGNRLGIFATRVAPVQLHYLGYPGTLGADFIDYLVADTTIIPVEHQQCFTEKIIYLPDTYQVNDRSRKIASVQDARSDHGLPDNGFVYCCFNNSWKITPDVFDVWMRLLKQVEGSVLWLFEDNEMASANLRHEATKRGVSPNRMVFARHAPLDQHLARHRHADLFLDTWYCNAHTTASDSLWSGLPLITKLGDTYASRVSASLLRAIELPELVTESKESYEALALDLAKNPKRLAEIRNRLVANRLRTPLFDTPRFTRNIETAYEIVWGRYQAGLQPDHIHI